MEENKIVEENKIMVMLEGYVKTIKSWNAFLTSATEQPGAKQSYFLDAQEDISLIKSNVDAILRAPGVSQQVSVTCNKIIDIIVKTITDFMNDCSVINENITEEEITPIVTEESINAAMNNNKTTQRMMNSMNELEKQQQVGNATPYTHMLVVNGKTYAISARNQKELEETINQTLAQEKEAPKTLNLYAVSYKEIPLKSKTVVAIA